MFHATWSQFFYTAALVIGFYYAIAVLLLYSGEIIAFAKSGFRKNASPHPEHVQPTSSVMGEARTNDMAFIEERVGELRGPLNVVEEDGEPEMLLPAGASKQGELKTLAEEVIGEVDSVVRLAVDCQSDEAETASLFNALLIRHPDIGASSFRASINQAIVEAISQRMQFRVTVDQVDQWWNE
jgi:hypothetical protein